jgi:hypothetical protein
MDYEKILKMINKMELKKGDTCMICHFPIKKTENKSTLSCNHCYHYECIEQYAFKNFIKCPYCSIKCTFKRFQKLDYICEAILKSGKNKGNKCGIKNCKRHKQPNKCNAILKSGNRKGEQCMRINCKYHNKNKTITI